MQRRACIASRMLSSSVVSPRQTLRELARVTKPSPSISGTAHAFTDTCASQCAEGLHFSAFSFVLQATASRDGEAASGSTCVPWKRFYSYSWGFSPLCKLRGS